MQRSFTYQKILKGLGIAIVFGLYQSLSSIYLLLPPLFGVLFFYFIRALKKENLPALALIIVLLLIFEAEKDFLLFSSLVYFTFVYRFITPHLKMVISCKICLKALYMVLAYPGFILYSIVLNEVLWVELPSVDWHILYYMFIEFFMVFGL